MSLAVATNLFWAAILTLIFPRLTDALGNTGALGLFAGLNVIAFVMIFLLVPETKQRTLEELDSICTAPTHDIDEGKIIADVAQSMYRRGHTCGTRLRRRCLGFGSGTCGVRTWIGTRFMFSDGEKGPLLL